MPLDAVDVAVVEVRLMLVACIPAENVEVAAAIEVMVPSLAMLKRVEVTPAAVVEPIIKRLALFIVELACSARRDVGVEVPTPTLPSFLIAKSVEVAVPAVVDAMTNSVVGAPVPLVEVAASENCAYGVVVPRPTKLLKIIVEVVAL